MQDNPHTRSPDVYFEHICFSKPLCDGMEFISRLERKTIKQTANELMMQTIKDYMAGLIREAARYEV